MNSASIFTETNRDSATAARAGVLSLPRGDVQTPTFMPVGTAGAVKAVRHDTVQRMGYRLILGNTYHLVLRPGIEVLESFGGLHRFSTWRHNILTDSGGYQIFSLAPFRKISDEGARFQSHIDGSRHDLTPERAVDIQRTIGTDIQMVLDVCTGADEGRSAAEEALRITTLWAKRAKSRWNDHRSHGYTGSLFGIVQGNVFPDLRTEAVDKILSIGFPGVAIGGLSVGETFARFEEILGHTAPQIPSEFPRYVMGIGTPELVLSAIGYGIDMFDCVFPTRAGRNGTLLTTQGRINIRNSRFAHSDDAPDPVIDSFGGEAYSLGYLRHLFKTNEILGPMLATEHNLRFMKWLVDGARAAIRAGTFREFRTDVLTRFFGDYSGE